MAYPQLEELTSRKREKVALFFTAEHMAGMLAVGLPAYVATLGTTFWLRALVLVLAAVVGVLLTSDIGGMAAYERAAWWLRGRLRRAIAGKTLEPLEFATTSVEQHGRAVPLGRAIRRKRAARATAAPTTAQPFSPSLPSHVHTPFSDDASGWQHTAEGSDRADHIASDTGDVACIPSS